MTAFPDVSIVIAARDAADFIGDTIKSVVEQDLSSFELILVDDGSRDSTLAEMSVAAATDPRIRVLHGQSRGVSAARNLGLSHAAASIVVFLDADDLLHSTALTRFVAALGTSDAVAALGGVLRISEAGVPLPGADNRDLLPGTDTLGHLLVKNLVVNGGALAIRTDAARLSGAFDESLVYGEDWEFWCRLAEHGDFVAVTGAPVLRYRQRSAGANYVSRGTTFGRVPCLERLAGRPSLNARYGKRLKRLLRARRIDIFWSGVRNDLQFGRRRRAFMNAAAGLVVYPDSVLRPRLALRLIRSMVN